MQIEKVRYTKSKGNGRLQRGGQCWTWVTPALVPLVLRGGFCYGWKCGTSMSSKDASFWWVNLDNNWITQVYSHMSSGGKHSWKWARKAPPLGETPLLCCSRVFFYRQYQLDGKNLPALEPLSCQSSTELHAVVSVYYPCIYMCLSHGT